MLCCYTIDYKKKKFRMDKISITQLTSSKSEQLSQFQERLFKIYIHESIASNGTIIKFRNIIFLLHICNDLLLYITQQLHKIIPTQSLLDLLSYIEKQTLTQVTTNLTSDPYVNELFYQTQINIEQTRSLLIAKPLFAGNDDISQAFIEIIERYKIAATDGINNKLITNDLEEAMLNKSTSFLSKETKKYVMEQLLLVHNLWEISINSIYTKERLIYLSNTIQTSADKELALHEILEKIIKTSTSYQLLLTLRDICAKHDDTTLAIVLQHSNLQILQQITPYLKKPYIDKIEAIQKNVISVRASRIYNLTDFQKPDAIEIIKDYESTNKIDENTIYQFCNGEPSYGDIKKLYIYAISVSSEFTNTLLAYSRPSQLELIYDTVVLKNLHKSVLAEEENTESPKELLLNLGYKIYHEIKYRINYGMELSIYGKDIEEITRIWKDRFVYFDKTLRDTQDNILNNTLLALGAT